MNSLIQGISTVIGIVIVMAISPLQATIAEELPKEIIAEGQRTT